MNGPWLNGHMRAQFHLHLQAISDDLIAMTDHVRVAIADATIALLDGDRERAERVIGDDPRLDELNDKIEDACLWLAATQQPVAADLRALLSGMRMAGSLERMGDLAEHVAKQARMRYPETVVPEQLRGTFQQMGALCEAVALNLATVIRDRDVALAEEIQRQDEELDDLHRQLFTIMLRPEWQEDARHTIDVTLLSRFYERFGDHACSVARRVVHIATGTPYAHNTHESDESTLPV
jgi:phosphate transport system protein